MNTPTEPPPSGDGREPSGLPTWLKVVLWTSGILVGVPVLGVLLLFGYCAVAGR